MLARCAAPPPGSWGPWEDAAPSPDAEVLGPVVPESRLARRKRLEHLGLLPAKHSPLKSPKAFCWYPAQHS
ncbi:hypothetical protein I79_020294 [Cricetulus griseus]|uniref:Uncharacterized protein n=1 Tax=Cricetulus griseus TaxID=10029 RepID=G3I9P0_CRIGR|nr:hypothetical protein I79_020294 [Cricetulus griseus]